MKQRVQLWPLWAVVLGLWFPLEFLAGIDGYHHFLRPLQFPFVYAAGWTTHAAPMLLLVVGLAIGDRLVLRTPWVVRAAQWLVLVAARALVGVVLVYALREWLRSVSPGSVSAVPISLRMVTLIMLIVAGLLTWRNAVPGRLLLLSRRVAIGSAIAVAILIPLEFVIDAVATRQVAHKADLKRGDKPDVVLITIDTLAAGHMSLYGYGLETTPRLDAFARGATVFEHFYANSNFTSPSSASFLYGVRSWSHRAWNVGSQPVDAVYGRNLLQAFHDAGYQVLSVDTNPCAAPGQNRVLPWVDDLRGLQVRTAFLWSFWPDRWLPSFDAAFVSRPTHRLERIIDKAFIKLGWFEGNDHFAPEAALDDARELWSRPTDRPRFLWVHLFGPHDPYASPPPFLGQIDPSPGHRTRFDSSPPYQWNVKRDPDFPRSLVGRYDEGVRYVDYGVGEFLDWLKQDGSFEGAVIAISSDHGEGFSHGYGGHGGPLLSEELIRIPLLVKAPAQSQAQRTEAVAEHVDLPQILLQLAGLPLLEGVEGRAVAAGAPMDDDPAFAMNFERNRRFDQLTTGSIAMVQGRWKYVHYLNLKKYVHMPAMSDQLYDLGADPNEQNNLAAQQPERAAAMKAAILAELDQHDEAVP
jgi:arylsulfatase A-like enzyme